MKNKFIFGMNIHHRGYEAYPEENLDKYLDSCIELNQNMVRFNLVPETEDDFSYLNRVAQKCNSRGLELMLVTDDYKYCSMELNKIEEFYEKYFFELGTKMLGKISIYQLFNEMDVTCMHNDIGLIVMEGADGQKKEHYDPQRWEQAIRAVKGACVGLRKSDKNAKICINFAWWHTALIYEMVGQGCDFDIVGIDWYSDGERASSIKNLTEDVNSNLPDKDIILCEVNYWMHPHPADDTETRESLYITEQRFKKQAEWISSFVKKVYNLSNPTIKGIICYELMDEPIFECEAGKYHGESHFGFISCDKNGGNRKKKPAFFALKEAIIELNKNTNN